MLSSFKSSPCIVLVTHRPVNTVLRIRPCTQRYKEKRASVCLFPVASVPGFPWLSGVWSTGCACVSLAPKVVVLLQSYPLSRWKRHVSLNSLLEMVFALSFFLFCTMLTIHTSPSFSDSVVFVSGSSCGVRHPQVFPVVSYVPVT